MEIDLGKFKQISGKRYDTTTTNLVRLNKNTLTFGGDTVKAYLYDDGTGAVHIAYSEELKAIHLQPIKPEDIGSPGAYMIRPLNAGVGRKSYVTSLPAEIKQSHLPRGSYLPHPDNAEIFVFDDTADAKLPGSPIERELLWLETGTIELGDYVIWQARGKGTPSIAFMCWGKVEEIVVTDKEPRASIIPMSRGYRDMFQKKTSVKVALSHLFIFRKGEKE